MARPICSMVLCAAIGLLSLSPLAAAEEKAEKAKKPAPAAKAEKAKEAEKKEPSAEGEKPSTHKVSAGPLKIEVSLKGAFEAAKTAEIAVDPKAWATLEVARAAEHGQQVKRGELLVEFDLEKLDEAIADLRAKLALGELSLKQAAENLKALEASVPLDLKAAEQAQKIAREDLEKFLKKDRSLLQKNVEQSLKSAEFMLENQRDELRQLEKMYEADDLTEETEAIVLKRQRRQVEAAEHVLEMIRAQHDDAIKIDLPRRQEMLEQAAKKNDILAQKAQATLPVALSQARQELDKLKIERTRDERKLQELLADRESLTVRSPIDGIVYYGRFNRGKWSGSESVGDALRRGGTVTKNAVLMTVVQLRPLEVLATVPESDLGKLRPALEATIVPAALPEMKLAGRVVEIGSVPVAADSFEMRLSVALDKSAERIVPGMACTVKLVPYNEKKAIAIPEKALFSDEPDDGKPYVYRLKDGKPQKQPVRVGKKADDKVEIIGGLSEGDEILLERPKK